MSKKQIKNILVFISDKYNIPYNTLELEINNIINNDNINSNYNECKCHAYIMVNGIKVQCSRSKKDDDFCLTHHKQYIKNTLKYGRIDKNNINKNKNKIQNIKEKENYKNPVNVEYISVNNTDYLFNPENNYVYDFNTHKKIGKLDNDLNLIKRSKIKINKV